ncbi:MAG TPA: hypothetical protein VEL07_09965 [Planctomycetota bacterium]|nr:hypothetical protein [Planctomycetota bacterium]
MRLTATILLIAAAGGAHALELRLPLGRDCYQTDEEIPLTLVRGADAAPAGALSLELAGDDGSSLSFRFDLPALAAGARAVEHLALDGRLLRPGAYRVAARADGAAAETAITVHAHLRRSDFALINWGRATGQAQLVEGEDSLGFNLWFGHYGRDDQANFLRAGMDYMTNCAMSGGHQMDLRSECDWSDPYVTRGGTVRAVQAALKDRRRPNVPGVHFYDEPGLTWMKDPATGQVTPHAIPWQKRSYEAAFGEAPIRYDQVDPANPEHVRRWKHWATWKLGFMDAAWREAQFGVSHVDPSLISVTQSQYGFSAFTDGYYFNVARSLPVTSGHGGYDDWGPWCFNPSFTLEMARARDLGKPCWYLPTWYGNTPWERYRAEQYLSFQTNLQGMMCPPDIDPFDPASKPGAEGVVETNQLMARLGPVFATMPPTRTPVTILYSLSHLLHAQARDRSIIYAHAERHGAALPFAYLAGKLLHHQCQVVVDEDIVDGTLAAHHRAIILVAVDHLDPAVVNGLEAFIAAGGVVILDGDSDVAIAGAVKIAANGDFPDAATIAELEKAGDNKGAGALRLMTHWLAGAKRLADDIAPVLAKAGIEPVFACDNPGIAASRQAQGDVEYLFAVNASHDAANGDPRALAPARAAIALADDGRPIYDAVRGGIAVEAATGAAMTVSFGAGQMRVFARTARPIGGVRVHQAAIARDYTTDQPLRLDLAATVVDAGGDVLSGSIPLRLRISDANGNLRFDGFRATRLGTCAFSMPLAANDPPGAWTIEVGELLARTGASKAVTLAQPTTCAHAAGRRTRAVAFGLDREHAFRFARLHRAATIVHGGEAWEKAAAERLAAILKPWDLAATVVAADAVALRTPTAEEAPTWINGHGLHAGFDLPGHAILIGTPQSNAVIGHLAKADVLPYPPDAGTMPGPGRGYLSWQRDIIGHGRESLTLIGYDAAGIGEAVGSLADAVAGMEPLTRWESPVASTITTATAKAMAAPLVAWQVALADRAIGAAADGTVLTLRLADGSIGAVDAAGAAAKAGAAPEAIADHALPAALAGAIPKDRIAKRVAIAGTRTAVGCWGGTLLIYDGATLTQRTQLDQDVCALAWLGDTLVAALADGRVQGLTVPR